MDKANGDAPFIPLYGTAVPGAGLGRLAGLPAAGLRLHRGQAAPEPGVYAAENTVFQIRRRLRPHAGGHDFIRTVAGLGYQFNPG